MAALSWATTGLLIFEDFYDTGQWGDARMCVKTTIIIDNAEVTSLSIKAKALRRVAYLFKRPLSVLRLDDRFGIELDASFVSDFRRNEMDRILFDVEDIAEILDDESVFSHIVTVNDFCNLVDRLYKANPNQCEMLFARWEKEQKMVKNSQWRGFLSKILDFFKG
jgi:hypothetical protein